MTDFEKILSGGDLRSIGKSNLIILQVKNQQDFDELFKGIFHPDRIIVMRTADVIEKITVDNPQYLFKFKQALFDLMNIAKDKELKWHLALLIPRLTLDNNEFVKIWEILTNWAKDKNNSRIVRVNSIQGLHDLNKKNNKLEKELSLMLKELEKENIPSINARIKKLNMAGQ